MNSKKTILSIVLFLATLLPGYTAMLQAQEQSLFSSLSMEPQNFVPLGIKYTKNHPVVVVADWDFAPFSYCDNDGKPTGYIPDIVDEIFSLIHVPYKLKMMDPLMAKNQLAMRKADMMLDVCKQDESNGLVYGNAIFGDYPVAIARGKNMKAIHNICDFSVDDTVYFRQSDYADDYVQHTLFSRLRCHTAYLDPRDAIQRIAEGKKIYFVWGAIPLRLIMKNWKLDNLLALDDVKDIPPGTIRVQSTDSYLLEQLDRQQSSLTRSGRYAKVQKKWFGVGETADYVEESPAKTIFIVVIIVFFIVGGVFSAILFFRGGNHPYRLGKEFHAIDNMASSISGSKMLVLGYKHMMVKDVKGDVLPEPVMRLQEYEKRIHPEDLLNEYALRNAFFNSSKCPPELTLRIHSPRVSEGFFKYHVYTSVRYSRLGHPVKLYMALVLEE